MSYMHVYSHFYQVLQCLGFRFTGQVTRAFVVAAPKKPLVIKSHKTSHERHNLSVNVRNHCSSPRDNYTSGHVVRWRESVYNHNNL